MKKYKKVSCGHSKTEAKSKAKSMRSRGLTAALVPSAGGKYCIASKGKRKKRRKR